MIYLYAIVDDPEVAVSGLLGLGDVPVVRVAEGAVAAICSVHRELEPVADSAALWQHERVTGTLMERCSVAPVRFFTVLADLQHVRTLLSNEHQFFMALLSRLRGKVELAVRAASPGASAGEQTAYGEADLMARGERCAGGSPGRDYLRALGEDPRVAPESGLDATLAGLHALLCKRSIDSRLETARASRLVAAYLVESGEVEAFRGAVTLAHHDYPGVRMSLTGPWAPYSFVQRRVMAND